MIDNLIGMGFPVEWCVRAANHHFDDNLDESSAIAWIIEQMEMDSINKEEDEEDEEEDEEDEEDGEDGEDGEEGEEGRTRGGRHRNGKTVSCNLCICSSYVSGWWFVVCGLWSELWFDCLIC